MGSTARLILTDVVGGLHQLPPAIRLYDRERQAILVLAGSITLDRSQATIEDTAFMSSMIPHHSMAILRAERAGIEDVRVCELAVAISEAQRREIAEMEWLIKDIEETGRPRRSRKPRPDQYPSSSGVRCGTARAVQAPTNEHLSPTPIRDVRRSRGRPTPGRGRIRRPDRHVRDCHDGRRALGRALGA